MSSLISLKSDETFPPRVVRMAIETTAIRNSSSAYSTMACPSSRSRAALRARIARIGRERSMSTIVLLLGLAVYPAKPDHRALALYVFQPRVPPPGWTPIGHRSRGPRVLLLEGWVGTGPSYRSGDSWFRAASRPSPFT